MKRQLPLLLCTLLLSGLLSACHGGYKQGSAGYYNKKAKKAKKDHNEARKAKPNVGRSFNL